MFALPNGNGAAALQNACPHAGVGLARGDIDEIDIEDLIPAGSAGEALAVPAGASRRKLGCVACPAHSWVFDLLTGACITNPTTPDALIHKVEIDPSGSIHVSTTPVNPTTADRSLVQSIPQAVVHKIQVLYLQCTNEILQMLFNWFFKLKNADRFSNGKE